MAIKCNGSTGYLAYDGALGLTYPYWMIGYIEADAQSGTHQMAFGNGQAAADYYDGCVMQANAYTPLHAWSRHPGESNTAALGTVSVDTTLRLAIIVFVSASVRKIFFINSSNTASSNYNIGTNAPNANRFSIGAAPYNSTTTFYWNGSIAEVWFGTGDLSSDTTSMNALFGQTLLPENTPGRIDGWKLTNNSDLVSYTGTRTLTLVGGVTTSSLTHPITRVNPDGTASGATLTSTESISGGAASGNTVANGNASGATLTSTESISGGAASGVVAGTLTTKPLKMNNTALYANAALTLNIYDASTGALVLHATGLTTNSSGVATVTSASITTGTTYAYEPVFTSGARRLPTGQAT